MTNTEDELADTLIGFGVKPDLASRAAHNIERKEVQVVGFSGKQGSGKNYTSSWCISHYPGTVQEDAFGINLKAELGQIIATISEKGLRADKLISQEQGVSLEQASKAVEIIFDDVMANTALDGFSRTASIRELLVYWAEKVRREQDPYYWVKPVLERTAYYLTENTNVFVTDVRYVNEAKTLLGLRAPVIRIDIDEETQKARIGSRDGIATNPEVLASRGETELDNFDSFTLRVDAKDPSLLEKVLKNLK